MLLGLQFASADFTDQTAALGLTGKIGLTQASVIDINNDGLIDISSLDYLYFNNGTIFTNRIYANFYGGQWGDFNNDGWVDCFNPNLQKLYQSNLAINFTEVTLPLFNTSTVSSGCLGDFNSDGWLDLYIPGKFTTDTVLMNNKDGTFSNTFTYSNGYDARGVTACDFDVDGDLDVYVSNYLQTPNQLMQNNGDNSFSNVAGAFGVAGDNPAVSPSFNPYGHTIGSSWGDFDNDGYFDLFVGNFNHHDSRSSDESKFLRNLGPSGSYHFELKKELDSANGLWRESFAQPNFADYDNDGDLDLFITTVYAGNTAILLRNDGNWTFTDVTSSEGLANINTGGNYLNTWADMEMMVIWIF